MAPSRRFLAYYKQFFKRFTIRHSPCVVKTLQIFHPDNIW